MDIERLERINHTLSLIPAEARAQSCLRPLELLVIAPSERIDAIAARHTRALPGAVRRLFGGMAAPGEAGVKGAALASYLLFESAFTQELMALGRTDTLRQREEVCLLWLEVQPAPLKSPVPLPICSSRHYPRSAPCLLQS